MRAILLTALLGFVAPDRADLRPLVKSSTPHDLILGDWQLERMFSGNNDVGSPYNNVTLLRITRTELLIIVDGQPIPHDAFSGLYTLDMTKSPLSFDLNKNQYKGIVRVEGDRMLMSMSLGGQRPNGFEGAARNGATTLHMKRYRK